MSELSADQLASVIDGATAPDIAQSIARLIRVEEIRAGDRLPTVRSLASALGVGRSTIADAWRILSDHSFIETARRNGTIVRDQAGTRTGRYWGVPADASRLKIDLSTGTPDVELLPPIRPALARLTERIEISSYIDPPIVPELEERLVELWPYEPEMITIVDGALDALDRLVTSLVTFGDSVVVEDPTFPPLLDMLEMRGATIVPVGVDERGPIPSEFAAALASRPVACFFQPCAQNPTGVSTDPMRLTELAALIRGTERAPWIVEDDHSGGAITATGSSLAALVPDRSATIVSFSKTHGPDLRLAAIGGAVDIVEPVVERRRLGPTWSSRLLQLLLLDLLTDDATNELILEARQVYAERRSILTSALAGHGIDVNPGAGLNLWVPVADDNRATWALAVEQIGVAPGSPFRVRPTPDQCHLRVSIGTARTELDALADALARAATA